MDRRAETIAPGWMEDAPAAPQGDADPGRAEEPVEPSSRLGAWLGTVRGQLTVVLVLAAAPGFAMLFLHGADSRDEARRRAGDDALRTARVAAAEQSRRIEAAAQVLEGIAREPLAQRAEAGVADALLRSHLQADPAYGAFVLASPVGAIRSAATRPGSHVPPLPEAPWFARAVTTHRTTVGEVELGPRGELVVAIARPVLDERGALTAVAVSTQDLSSVADLVPNSANVAGTRITWLDARGDVLAERPQTPSFVGTRFLSDPALRAAFTSDEGVAVGVGPDSTRQIVGYARFFAPGSVAAGRVVVTIPEAMALAPANAALLRSSGWLAALGLVALLVARRFAVRNVLVPLGRLSRAAERLRTGDTTARAGPPYRAGEVGHLQRAFDTMADALERDRREFAAAERKYRALVEELPAVLYVLRVAQRGVFDEVLYVSPQVCSLGIDASDLNAGRLRWADTVHMDDRQTVVDALARTVQTGEPFEIERRVATRDGTTRWLRDTGVLVRDDSGRPVCIRGFAVDVTERKVLEEQLQRSQKLEAVGQLAAGVAHDFNNLLTVILGYTHLLDRMTANDANLRGQLHEIQKAGDRAATLTHRLLAFTRKRDASPQVIDLRASVAEMEQMISRLLGPRIEVRIVTDGGAGLVHADPGHIDQILMNLVVNARDAMADGGRLVIEVYDRGPRRPQPGVLPGPYVCMSVADTGCGMDAATQRRIFEPFFTTKAEGKGTGLGLATVYALVKQSGGFVAFESEVGQGTTFRVYLPRVDTTARNMPLPDDSHHDLEPLGSGTVLVVDDEDGVRALACAALADRGYTVLEAARGDDALRVAASHDGPLAALVTDIGLPGMDGRELAARLVAARPGTPVLLMSGYAESIVREGGRDLSEAAFIAKPFTPRALVRTLRDVVTARAAAVPEALAVPSST